MPTIINSNPLQIPEKRHQGLRFQESPRQGVHPGAFRKFRVAGVFYSASGLGFKGLGLKGFGAHTRTIQARHVVRRMKGETSLRE